MLIVRLAQSLLHRDELVTKVTNHTQLVFQIIHISGAGSYVYQRFQAFADSELPEIYMEPSDLVT